SATGSWRTWRIGQAVRTRTGESSRLPATNTPGAPPLPGPSSMTPPRWTSLRSTIETCSPRSSVCNRAIESKSSCPPRPTDICPSWVGMNRSRPSWGSASRATAVDSAGGLAASGSRNAPTAQDTLGRVRSARPEPGSDPGSRSSWPERASGTSSSTPTSSPEELRSVRTKTGWGNDDSTPPARERAFLRTNHTPYPRPVGEGWRLSRGTRGPSSRSGAPITDIPETAPTWNFTGSTGRTASDTGGSPTGASPWQKRFPTIRWARRHERRPTRSTSHPSSSTLFGNTSRARVARALLLLESSDWPFLITTVAAKDYAEARVKDHIGAFDRLRSMLPRAKDGTLSPEDLAWLATIEARDSQFPDLDLKSWTLEP